MSKKRCTILLQLALVTLSFVLYRNSGMIGAAETSGEIRILGLVDRPLTLTYDDLLSFPMVSEVATLKCVFGIPTVTYNWTGIPLFCLLTLAEVKPTAFKVVFRASDGFSSDLPIEEALRTTTVLALGANGSTLPEINGIQGLFRMVVPCKWGYKWVGNLEEIEVVDYDYEGTYESSGFSDEADVPDCELPGAIVPPLQVFNLTFGNRMFEVDAFTNASITSLSLDYLQKRIDANVTVLPGGTAFAVFVLQQDFLVGPYSAFLDERAVDLVEVNVTRRSFLYLIFSGGSHALGIVGSRFLGAVPKIVVEYNQTVYVDQTVIFDANKSTDEGQIVSYRWDFDDGTSGNGAVVFHKFTEERTYQVKVNVTNNDGLSSLETLAVTVRNPQEVPLALKLLLSTMLAVLVLTFIILLLRRRTRPESKCPKTESFPRTQRPERAVLSRL